MMLKNNSSKLHAKNVSMLPEIKRNVHQLLSFLLNGYIKKRIPFWLKETEDAKWDHILEKSRISEADTIFTYTHKDELRALYNLAASCSHGSFALEIGSHLGASSCYIAAGLMNVGGHLFCVDTWNNETMPEGEQDTLPEFQKNVRGVQNYLTPVRKRSEDLQENDIRVPLHMVFIDGDHSYQAVKRDFECVKKMLAEDGIIAFHDFSNSDFEGVTRVVGEAIASGEWIILGMVKNLVWIKPAEWSNPAWLQNSQLSS